MRVPRIVLRRLGMHSRALQRTKASGHAYHQHTVAMWRNACMRIIPAGL